MREFYAIIAFFGITLASQFGYALTKITLKPTSHSKTPQLQGYILAKNTHYGLLLTPHLIGVAPGMHGFHVHQQPNCAQEGKAAGGHFDPKNTKQHRGPYYDAGHLGDMPALYADQNGSVTLPVLAPRLNEAQLKHHAIILHAAGDNYSDIPAQLGGGGARAACGVVN